MTAPVDLELLAASLRAALLASGQPELVGRYESLLPTFGDGPRAELRAVMFAVIGAVIEVEDQDDEVIALDALDRSRA